MNSPNSSSLHSAHLAMEKCCSQLHRTTRTSLFSNFQAARNSQVPIYDVFLLFLGKNRCYHTYTRLNSQHCRNEASFKLSSSLPLPATFTFTFHSKMMMMMIRQNFSLFLCTLCAPWLLSVESLRTTLCTFPSFSAVFFFFILHHDDVARL